jgi:phosphohistidine phosphatase
MQVLIVRHAPAVPQGSPGVREEERSLTPEGEAKFRLAARGLARVVDAPDALLTSPLRRARQTADIAAKAWGALAVSLAPALAQDDLDAMVALLGRQERKVRAALFGHEPSVSALLARLLGLGAAAAVGFKKGGAALVEIEDPRQPGSARLIWFLPPGVLRALGGGED